MCEDKCQMPEAKAQEWHVTAVIALSDGEYICLFCHLAFLAL